MIIGKDQGKQERVGDNIGGVEISDRSGWFSTGQRVGGKEGIHYVDMEKVGGGGISRKKETSGAKGLCGSISLCD